MTKKWLAAALAVVLAATLTPDLSEAKRLGGGKSFGMQRQAPAKPAPTTPAQPATPATPGQAAPTAGSPAVAGAAAAAAAPAKRSWMGPLAGLAAGLGLAALASHFGFGEGLANIMMMALLAIAAVFLVRFVMARMGNKRPQEALAGVGGTGRAASPVSRLEPAAAQPMERAAFPAAAASTAGAAVSVTGQPLAPIGGTVEPVVTATAELADAGLKLPEGFDLPAFERVAKMIFIRLQAANDAGDLDDLREFTTPEMFAAIRLELQERGSATQQTDVERVDAELVDYTQEATRHVASVRFHGLVREQQDAASESFDEIWHLVKPADGSRAWAISGIQQPQH